MNFNPNFQSFEIRNYLTLNFYLLFMTMYNKTSFYEVVNVIRQNNFISEG